MIKAWFPTLILTETLEEFSKHNSYFANKAQSLKLKFNSTVSTNWDCDTFNTMETYDLKQDNDQIINNFIETCKRHVLNFSKEFGVKQEIQDLECHNFWFNIAMPGNYQELHQHSNSHFSAVYYVSAEKNAGDIVFKSLEHFSDMSNLPIANSDLTAASFKACSYTPINSTLLVFRSNLPHQVNKNLSNLDRISISMNFRFK
jgi:uncharacterized protein (TIGR02466 family)